MTLNLKLSFEERKYCQTFAIYMEGLLPFTMKISMNGKWNKTKKKHLASLSLWKNCGKQLML
jgi:hypothetical protein